MIKTILIATGHRRNRRRGRLADSSLRRARRSPETTRPSLVRRRSIRKRWPLSSERARTATRKTPSGPGTVTSRPSPGCSRATFNKPART